MNATALKNAAKPLGLLAAAGLAYALYPADKNASIPMGFQYEKEAVGEVPQMAEESAPAIKGARD